MKLVLLSLFAVLTGAQGKSKASASAKGKHNTTSSPTPYSLLNPDLEKIKIEAAEVNDIISNAKDSNNGQLGGTTVDLVLQAINDPINATCNMSSHDFKVCVEGYNSQDCVFSKSVATFGGANCIPYLSDCGREFRAYCRSKVPADEKCSSPDACSCANEPGCGWSEGHQLCLVGRPLVSCGACPNMTRCGTINCLQATRPCDCVALGGKCGWSTTDWKCESGKDTDCNECGEQVECGGAGVALIDSKNCPKTRPSQLAACAGSLNCQYDKVCCQRCAGSKQVCAFAQASCDGRSWTVTAASLNNCPNCNGYYYDAGYYEDSSPSAPLNVTASEITSSSAVLAWKHPVANFIVGTDGYSVAYALPNVATDITILNVTTKTTITLTGLKPDQTYKVSILPVVNATEDVGEAAHYDFKTLSAPAGKGKKAKAAPKKATTTKGKKL
jgi:hypothetical protein